MKLNCVSAMYAFQFFIQLELMVNIYRISRLTHWELSTVNKVVISITAVLLIIFTALLLLTIRRWMEYRKSTFWALLLWIPYLILFVYIFVPAFPIRNPEEVPSPVLGLFIFGMIILYPVYIALVNLFGLGLHKYL